MPEHEVNRKASTNDSNQSLQSIDNENGAPQMRTLGVKKALEVANKKLCQLIP